MSSNSQSMFARTINEHTNALRASVEQCIRQFFSPSANDRRSSAETAFASAERLKAMLIAADRPAWLVELASNLQIAIQHHSNENSIAALQAIAILQPRLKSHQWDIAQLEATGHFDFDAVFEKCRKECRITELFDEVIEWLQKIVESDDVDSRRMVQELEQVIATLKKSRTGSYLAQRSAWSFLKTWMHHSKWEYLTKIPLIGPLMKGLHKTLEDGDKRMVELHEAMQAEVEAKIIKDFPMIAYSPIALPVIEYEGTAGAEIIDAEIVNAAKDGDEPKRDKSATQS